MTQMRECRPAGNGTGIHHTTATVSASAVQSSRATAQDVRAKVGGDHSEPVTADDRLDAQVLAEAQSRGFRLAVRGTRCGQWLVARKSVALHLGPVCRARGD
jgi:hypothetical protein